MKPTLNDKLIAYLALLSGLCISGIAEYYSIMGLIAIYPAMIVPVVIMGGVIGLGKISGLIWLKQNWEWSPGFIKAYLVPCIAVMMFITSVGCFGFLSKAHSDQSLVSGDVQSKLAIYDEKIKTEKESIDANRKILKQLDEGVDQVMARSSTEGSAEKAMSIRKTQQKDRSRISQEITESQKRIAQLNDERAPAAAEVRKVDAEVGPIKYIAAFIYGSNPDAGLLEKAVSWVSVLIVIVLDPMALVMLLASQYSFQHIREIEERQEAKEMPIAEVDTDTREKSTPEEALESLVIKGILEKGVVNFDPNDNMPLAGDTDLKHTSEITTNTIHYEFIEEDFEEDFLVENYSYAPSPLESTATKLEPIFTEDTTNFNERPGDYVTADINETPNYEGVKNIETGEWEQTGPNFDDSFERSEYVVVDGQRMHKRAAKALGHYVQNEEQSENTNWNRVISEAEYREKVNDNKNNPYNAA
jgi:hypothetical protein